MATWMHDNLGTQGYGLSAAEGTTNFCVPSTMLAWLESRYGREAMA